MKAFPRGSHKNFDGFFLIARRLTHRHCNLFVNQVLLRFYPFRKVVSCLASKCRHRFLWWSTRPTKASAGARASTRLPGGTWHGEMPGGFTEGCVPPILPKLTNVLKLHDGCPVQ